MRQPLILTLSVAYIYDWLQPCTHWPPFIREAQGRG